MRLEAFVAGLFLASAPGWAHHGTATDFDTAKLIVLHGIVTDVEWINPHAWIHLLVKDSEGKAAAWRIEGGSPGQLSFRNFPKESVTAGVEISITVYPARSGENRADGATITFPDGKRIFFGGSAPVDGLDADGKPCILHEGSTCQRP